MNSTDWISFGKVSAEMDDLSIKYFYENRLLNALVTSLLSFLILGCKGAGKTPVFERYSIGVF